jgi:hypothetical protein
MCYCLQVKRFEGKGQALMLKMKVKMLLPHCYNPVTSQPTDGFICCVCSFLLCR